MTVFVNQKMLETFTFPGGECHVRVDISDIGDKTEILAYLGHSEAILQLLLAVDAIRRVNPNTVINLTIPYFPYGRQDRVCNPGEALSLSVMANLINSLQCNQVTIYDPHSEVTPAQLNRCVVITLAQIITSTALAGKIAQNNLALVSPDAGAEKKIDQLIQYLESPVEVFYARKTRDLLTGAITSTNIQGNVSGKDLLILDDICDGGQTFIELAKVLKTLGARNLYLYVTHGIFSKGLDVLKPYFEQVYCYHTMLKSCQVDPGFLNILAETSAPILNV